MLNHSSWHFLLRLILLTVIYRSVKSYELNEAGGARKNIFTDMKNFFEGIFKRPKHISHEIIENTKLQQNTTPIMLDDSNLNLTVHVQRRNPKTYMKNKKNQFQSLVEDIQKDEGVSEVDIKMYFFLEWLSKFFNIPFKSYKDQEKNDSKEDNDEDNQRRTTTSNLRTLIILVTKKKKVLEEMIAREGLSYLGFSKSFTRDDLRQTMLRKAYGDACIKVAIRKCYKALQRVNDMVCSTRFKCKSSFKSTFLLKAKEGCITGFDYTKLFNKKKKPNKEKDMGYNSRALSDEKSENYIDACIPYMLSERSNTVREDLHLGNNLSQLVTQILRSDSDRKCQKFSREACVIACIFARDEVCSTYICGRQKKKSFKSDCKNECKRSYSIKSDSSAFSESGSD